MIGDGATERGHTTTAWDSRQQPSPLNRSDDGQARSVPPPARVLRKLASLHFTPWLIALLGAGTAFAYLREGARTWPLVIPLLLLALNLLAAVATNGVFRRQIALLVFHLCLIVLLLLVAAGRLTYLNGHAGVTVGTAFDGVLAVSEQGPWHAGNLPEVSFVNKGFTIEYAPGLQRGATQNLVAWADRQGHWHEAEIGDQDPLIVENYRFYTTFNKGFAPTFRWLPKAGEAMYGSVQLPPYPGNQYSQAAEWTPPASSVPVWVMLDFDEVVLDPERHTSFRLPERYKLIVRIGSERHEMQPGDSVELPDGRLEFDGLRSWMGYRVFYDWTLPWLLAACIVAIASLGVHFWQRFAAKPWDA